MYYSFLIARLQLVSLATKATLRSLREAIECAPNIWMSCILMSGIVSGIRTVTPDMKLGGRCAGFHAHFVCL